MEEEKCMGGRGKVNGWKRKSEWMEEEKCMGGRGKVYGRKRSAGGNLEVEYRKCGWVMRRTQSTPAI
jgi:hypothetical protein